MKRTALHISGGFWLASLLLLLLATAACAEDWYIPHITGEDGDWSSYLLVDNNSADQLTFILTLYTDGVEVYNQQQVVSGYGELVLHLEGLASGAQCGVVSSDSNALNFRVSYESSTTGLAEFTLPTTMDTAAGLFFSDFSTAVEWKGIALANFGAESVTYNLYAFGAGQYLGTASVNVGAKQRIRGVYQTWFSAVDFASMDSIIVVAPTGAVSGICISGNTANDKLLFTTSQPLTGFTPPTSGANDLTGTWSGTWRSIPGFPSTGSITLVLTHTGDNLSGTVSFTNSGCTTQTDIPVSGTYTGGKASLSATWDCNGQTAVMNLNNGVLVEGVLAGLYTETMDGSSFDNGTWNVTK